MGGAAVLEETALAGSAFECVAGLALADAALADVLLAGAVLSSRVYARSYTRR